ncbi:uncharacterized protein LOC111399543 [Olea europaea var. sylvestris]|uniref:uncharacterized protein LOC111399543 n=2 Tax=Olea europaea var. sylvestris TaxID=158386 RepID=UPI000C1D5D1B|nr:uncharacterized protein LOC111399543 [Olea europaea var. sylvestris]
MEDQHPSANNTRDTECKIPIPEGEGEDHHQYFDGRRIQRVPHFIRFKKHNVEDYYAPKIVSFGPYYHGLPELGMAEEFKHKALTMFVSSSGKDRELFYCQIFKVIHQIRNCYVGVSRDSYDDGALAEMILLDASFAIYLMTISLEDEEEYFHFCQHLGMAAVSLVYRDMNLLENQIPLWVIKLLINLIYGEGSMLLCNFLSSMILENTSLTRIPGEDKKQPLHLLDAYHRLLAQEWDTAGKILVQPVKKSQWRSWKKENRKEFGKCNRQFRSITDLKAKDVKELREKKILFSTLDSDEQVVEVIKEIDTSGLDNYYIFDDVKMRIEKHCSSKAKTWIAELIHTYFRNPWTFIALLAATFLLCLTFLQTYYTVNPK